MTEGKKLVFDDRIINATISADSNDWNLSGSSYKIPDAGRTSFSKVFFIILSMSVLATVFSVLIKLFK